MKAMPGRGGRVLLVGGIVFGLASVAAIVALVVVFAAQGDDDDEQDINFNSTTVVTDCGHVAGRLVKDPALVTGRCFEFINIPYASPPIGQLRWKNSILLSKANRNCWHGTYRADLETTRKCKQFQTNNGNLSIDDVVGDEDCLYLSVRSPNLKGKLPVAVWIHGGASISGYNDDTGYSADAEFTISMNMVTVNINYRLGPLGFLSIRELWDSSPGNENYGNYGYIDQVTALRWIKNNIANFGGDPDSVTIIGESAGGTSVLALLSSPLANGLFHRVFAQSPTQAHLSYLDLAAKNRLSYLARLDCNFSSEEDVRSCLYSRSGDEVIKMVDMRRGSDVAWFLPDPGDLPEGLGMSDPGVVPVFPEHIKRATFHPKKVLPVIISSMAQEVGIAIGQVFTDSDWHTMQNFVAFHLDKFNSSLTERVLHLYSNIFSSSSTDLSPQLVYETLTTDIRWTCQINRIAQGISESPHHRVFRLYHTHRPSTPFEGRRYSFHVWDAWALFKFKFVPNVTAHDYAMTDFLRSTLKQFVTDDKLDPKWQPYPAVTAEFRNEMPWTRYNVGEVQKQQCDFWAVNGFDKYSV